MKETAKEILKEYGIVTLIEKSVADQEAAEEIGNYVFNVLNRITELNKENSELKELL